MVQPGIQKITNPDPGKTYPGSGNKPILDLGSGKTPIPDPGYKKSLSQIQGSKRHRILVPGSGSETLVE